MMETRELFKIMHREDDLYYVHQNKGIDYIVSSKHKIVVKYCSDGYIGWRETENAHKLMWFDRNSNTENEKNNVLLKISHMSKVEKFLKNTRKTSLDLVQLRS